MKCEDIEDTGEDDWRKKQMAASAFTAVSDASLQEFFNPGLQL